MNKAFNFCQISVLQLKCPWRAVRRHVSKVGLRKNMTEGKDDKILIKELSQIRSTEENLVFI